jgi:hypothetical protein
LIVQIIFKHRINQWSSYLNTHCTDSIVTAVWNTCRSHEWTTECENVTKIVMPLRPWAERRWHISSNGITGFIGVKTVMKSRENSRRVFWK